MGTTSAGLTYPEPTDPVANVDLALKALAESVIGLNTALAITPAANWTLSAVNCRKIGTAWAWIDLVATRAAGAPTITASSFGNVTNVDIATLPAGWRPARQQFLAADRGSESLWRVVCNTAGLLQLSHGAPTATIVAGDTLTITDLVALF